MFTHSYRSAVAWHAAAHVVVSDDVNGVLFATVQVIKGAGGGVCGAHVGVAVQSNCDCHVGFCPIALGPADRAKTVLTVCEALYMLRHAGT